jgi:hypothetical protein
VNELIGKNQKKMAFISPIRRQSDSLFPFYTDDGVFDIEKRKCQNLLTLWKRDDEPPTQKKWHFQMQ